MRHIPLKTRKLCLLIILATGLVIGFAACSKFNNDSVSSLRDTAREQITAGQYQDAAVSVRKILAKEKDNTEGLFLWGRLAMRQKNIQTAAKAFGRVINLSPDHKEARLSMAGLLLETGQYDQARSHIDHVLNQFPDDENALILKSRQLLVQDQPEEAEKILNRLKENGKPVDSVFLLLARVKAYQKDVDAAEKVLLEGIDLLPRKLSLRLMLVRLYTESRQPKKAEAVIGQIIEKEPEDPGYVLMLAGHLWSNKENEKAEKILTDLISRDPENEDSRILVADFYLKQVQYEKAHDILKDAVLALSQSGKVHLALNRFYQATGQGGRGVDLLERYLGEKTDRTDKDLIPVYSALSRSYFQQQKLEDAMQYIEKILALNPDHLDTVFLKGRIEMGRGQVDQAVSAFKAVVSGRPDLEQGYLNLARAYILKQDSQSAVAILQKGVERFNLSKNMQLALAGALKAHKDYKGTEKALVRVLKMDPTDVQVQAELGDFYTEIKNYEHAKREYAEIIAKFPDKSLGYLKLSQLYFSLQQASAGIAELERGYQKNPGSAELITSLAIGYVAVNKADQAIALCRARLKKDPDEAFSHNLLGKIYLQQKENKKAYASFKKAVALAPQWGEPDNNLASLYLLENRTRDAVSVLISALKQNPKNPTAFLMLGRIHENNNELNKAIETYEQGISAVPDFWAAANRLAFILCHQDPSPENLDRALGLASAAYRLQPGRVDILDTLAWIYHNRGNNAQALALLQKINDRVTGNALFEYHLSMSLLEAGKKAEALNTLELALKGKTKFLGRNKAEAMLKELRANG